jgi:L-ascorbate metabolism protein UlaG (beta-lactamase superfamily)
MGKLALLAAAMLAMTAVVAFAQDPFQTDVIKTDGKDLKITFIGHGTLMFTYDGKVIHLDPWSKLADYSKLPKADLVLITHEHQDHLDPDVLSKIRTDKAEVVLTETCAQKVKGGTVMHNGDVKSIAGLKIEAVPAYNIVHKRDTGQPFHPKGVGNGYVITFGDKRVYVAGDTENVPEMKNLTKIDVAFLPMNLPYTMTPEMVADAARSFKPIILYPYHTGDTDVQKLKALLKDSEGIEIRFRSMK